MKLQKLRKERESAGNKHSLDLLFQQPTSFLPIIFVLKDYLAWKDIGALLLTNKSWASALRTAFYGKSEFYIEIETPLKRALVNRDNLDNSSFFRAYKYPMELFQTKLREAMKTLDNVFPFSEDDPTFRMTSLTIQATMLDECEEMERLLKWLKVFGTKVTRLTLYKPILNVIHERTLGSANMVIRKKTLHKLLECFPRLQNFQITGSKLNNGPLDSFMLTVVEDDELFTDVQDLFRHSQNYLDSDVPEGLETHLNVRKLRIREMFKSEGTNEIIELFPNMEKLTLKFLLHAEPFDRIHYLRRQNLLRNLKELDLIFRDQQNYFDKHTLYELSRMDFNCLQYFRIDRISVEYDMNDSGILNLIAFLEKVKDTMNKLEIVCMNAQWYMGERGRRFIEILTEQIPTMNNLRSLRLNTASENTPQPLLQVARKLPALEKLSFTHTFEMMNQSLLDFLPYELFVCKSLRSLKLTSVNFVLDKPFFRRLHEFFPDLEHLDLTIDCGAETSLLFYFRQVSKWPGLKTLRLRCKTIRGVDFNLSVSLLSYIGLESLMIDNASSSSVELSATAIKNGFRNIPYLELLQFKGFEKLKSCVKLDLFKTLGERNPRLSIVL